MKRRDLLAIPMVNFGRCRLHAGARQTYSVRTLDLVGRSLVVDMLGLFSVNWRQVSAWHLKPESFTADDFQPLLKSGIDVFNPAVDLNAGDPYSATEQWLKNWHDFLSAQPDRFVCVLITSDVSRAKRQKKIGVLLGMQNSTHFRSPCDVDYFSSLGQRLSQLTYNSRNSMGSGCMERADEGLTELGSQVIERMNAVGMVVDVSHAGDNTCRDVFALASTPVLITHANCRFLVPHRRCKPDGIIRGMAKTGGVMGITGIGALASRREDATINDVLDHFDHVVRIAGIEHVGIGSDSDLGEREAHLRRRGLRSRVDVAGLNHGQRIFDLVDGLLRRGYTDRHIELILGANFKRALDAIFSKSQAAMSC